MSIFHKFSGSSGHMRFLLTALIRYNLCDFISQSNFNVLTINFLTITHHYTIKGGSPQQLELTETARLPSL